MAKTTEYAIESAYAREEVSSEEYSRAHQLVESWQSADLAQPRLGIARGVAHLLRRQRSKRGALDATASGRLILQRTVVEADSVRMTVADCRRAVFGREQAPFATYDDARTWLKAQQRKCRYTGPQWSDRCARAWERAVKRLRRIRSDWRASLSFRFNGVPMVFWTDENGWPIGLPAYTPKLYALWHGTEDLAGLTGWSSPSALAYMLAGVVPAGRREPQVKWEMFGDQAGAFLVDVRLWPWHLNRQGVASILEYVRRWGNALPPMRKLATLRFTDKERRLLDLVADQGPPPPGRWKARRGKRKEYFDRLASLWKQAYGEQISRNALRKMWERIRPRYENAIAERPKGV